MQEAAAPRRVCPAKKSCSSLVGEQNAPEAGDISDSRKHGGGSQDGLGPILNRGHAASLVDAFSRKPVEKGNVFIFI